MKKKIKFIILFAIILFLLSILIYFCCFYKKTILYQCSNVYRNEFFSIEKPEKSTCKFYSIINYECKECFIESGYKDGFVIIYDRKINGDILYDYKKKKLVDIFENGNIKFISNDNKLYGYILHSISDNTRTFYNLNKKDITYTLDALGDFKSSNITGEKEETNIHNNLIIAYKNIMNNSEYEKKYGLVNLETGNIIIPFENKYLYRTTYGNFMAGVDGGHKFFYDENGNVIIKSRSNENGPFNANFIDIIELDNDIFLLDVDYSEFNIIDNKGNSLLKEKFSRTSVANDLIEIMDNKEVISLFKSQKYDFKISSYSIENNKYIIHCSYGYNGLSYSVEYEFDVNNGNFKKVNLFSQ